MRIDTEENARKAIARLSGTQLGEKKINVAFATKEGVERGVTVYLRGLPLDMENDELKEMARAHAEVVYRLILRMSTWPKLFAGVQQVEHASVMRHRGVGSVGVPNMFHASKLINALHLSRFKNRELRLRYANERVHKRCGLFVHGFGPDFTGEELHNLCINVRVLFAPKKIG